MSGSLSYVITDSRARNKAASEYEKSIKRGDYKRADQTLKSIKNLELDAEMQNIYDNFGKHKGEINPGHHEVDNIDNMLRKLYGKVIK